MDYKKIPIVIISYNRLECLKQLVEYLEQRDYLNIIILDNGSTYDPLLRYLTTLSYRVEHMNRNYGHLALWKSGFINNLKDQYYVLTDPDILPIEECPDEFMEHFSLLMEQFSEYKKIGFSLKIDDLPDHYPLKNEVLAWEKQFWDYEFVEGCYVAPIDTTFALYHPTHPGGWSDTGDRPAHPAAAGTGWRVPPGSPTGRSRGGFSSPAFVLLLPLTPITASP